MENLTNALFYGPWIVGVIVLVIFPIVFAITFSRLLKERREQKRSDDEFLIRKNGMYPNGNPHYPYPESET